MAAHPTGVKPAKKSVARLNPMDLFDVRSMLSEDEQMVQDSVGRLFYEKVIPLMR